MKEKILNFIKNNYPVLTILGIVVILFVTNYKPNTYLTGWDNLHPEFNFGINIKRSIFAVWQEYQGLGLLGGMGHSADLLRQFFLYFLSFILPNSLIRYFWIFLTLFIGSSGAYFLIKRVLESFGQGEKKLIALSGALFYLLNISTIQVFYVPFEAFTAHYASLPWIFLTSIIFIKKPNIKNALIAAVVFLLTSAQAYIPTLFVSSLIGIVIVSIPFFIGNFKHTSLAFLKLLAIIVAVNSLWLLPFIFFTLTSSSVNIDSKINQMATEIIYLQNKEFGNIFDVSILKGFIFSNVEPNIDGIYGYILGVWKTFFANPIVLGLSYFLFGTIIIGLIKSFKSKSKLGISFSLLFIFGFTMLTTSTPPFSIINNLIREHIPLFNQAFRFPYTKFLNLTSLAYGVLFSIGIFSLTSFFKNFKVKTIIPLIFIAIVVLLAFPAFRGNLFYQKNTLKIPNEYFQTFEFFKNQNPNTRIANFPQYTFWGWNFYNWNYSGSGFIWYGLPQPVLDRAFDVWSAQDENYYWELNRALYSKNSAALEAVFNKYDVDWIIIDKNVINPVSAKSLFTADLKDMISKLPIVKQAEFGNIEIYKVPLVNKPDSFISSLNSLSSANSTSWANHDQVYKSGDYASSIDSQNNKSFFPFRSIFTDKSQKEISFNVKENSDNIEFSSTLPEEKTETTLHIPSLITENNMLPINIVAKRNGSQVSVDFQLKAPQMFINSNGRSKKIWESTISQNLFIKDNQNGYFRLNINGVTNFNIPEIPDGTTKIVGTSSLTLDQDNILVLSDFTGEKTMVIPGQTIKDWFVQDDSYISLPKIEKGSILIIRIPKLNDQYSSFTIDPILEIKANRTQVVNCDGFRKQYFSYFIKQDQEKRLLEFSSKNATPCISFYLSSLDHDQGYFVSVENQNIQGLPLHFWVLNEDEKIPLTDTYFEKNQKKTTSIMVLPPMEKFGKAYSIHFDNISIGDTKGGNLLGKITITPIPYYFITNLRLDNPSKPVLSFNQSKLEVKHPNQSLYLVKVNKAGQTAISLSQSYSPYWKAYEVKNFGLFNQIFPFFGKEITDHKLINNWKNGWILNSSIINHQSSIIIVYLPQYLEYIGFFLSGASLVILCILYIKKRGQDSYLN